MHRHDSASFHASSPQVKAHNTSLRMRTQAKWRCVVSIPSPVPAQSAHQYSIHSVAYSMRQSHKLEKQPSALFFQPAPGVAVRALLSADSHYSTRTSLGKGLREAQNQWDVISSDGPGIERKKSDGRMHHLPTCPGRTRCRDLDTWDSELRQVSNPSAFIWIIYIIKWLSRQKWKKNFTFKTTSGSTENVYIHSDLHVSHLYIDRVRPLRINFTLLVHKLIR